MSRKRTLTNNHSEAITQMVIGLSFPMAAPTSDSRSGDTGTSSTDPNVTIRQPGAERGPSPPDLFRAECSQPAAPSTTAVSIYDGWNGTTGVGTPIPNLQGYEVVTLTFASGRDGSTLFLGRFPYAGTLLFDDANLVTGNGPAAGTAARLAADANRRAGRRCRDRPPASRA